MLSVCFKPIRSEKLSRDNVLKTNFKLCFFKDKTSECLWFASNYRSAMVSSYTLLKIYETIVHRVFISFDFTEVKSLVRMRCYSLSDCGSQLVVSNLQLEIGEY